MRILYWLAQIPRSLAILLLMTLRPLLGRPDSCHFYPTCTQYAYEQIQTKPLWIAFFKASYRVLQCNPFYPYINSLASWLNSLRSLCVRKTDPTRG